jgi:uncharacterized protein (TIGR02391 family)
MNINQIIANLRNNINLLVANVNSGMLGPYGNNVMHTCCSYINELSFETRNKNPKLYSDLQEIKSSLFNGAFVNIFSLGRIVQIMRSYDCMSTNDFWQFIHPKIIELSKNKFEDGYYSDAVQTALVEICSIVREYRKTNGLQEIQSDKDMMYNTFSTSKVLQFTDSSTTSLKNIQEGYEKIFPGVIQAMRNPNAHQNYTIEKDEAVRKLMVTSDLMYMLDNALAIKLENN